MKKLNKKGFTLIEVVLVLAIGGLIFLLAFVAFQQVSRNRRDTQRRADASRLVAAIANYKADKNNQLPATSDNGDSCSTATAGSFGEFLSLYICKDGKFTGPAADYQAVAPASFGTVDNLMYQKNYTCNSGFNQVTGGFKIMIKLENGIVCKDDQ